MENFLQKCKSKQNVCEVKKWQLFVTHRDTLKARKVMAITRIKNKFKKMMQRAIEMISSNPNSNNQDWSKEEGEKKANLVRLIRERIKRMTEESQSQYPQMN